MAEADDRRTAPRMRLAEQPAARVRDGKEVRLLDVSRMGARIEHLDFLRPGAPCSLELPPPLGSLSLPAQVVWCTVIGRKGRPDGESQLVSRSGLRFIALTVPQHAALAWLLGTSSPLDSPQGSA
jgi:PilZ domain